MKIRICNTNNANTHSKRCDEVDVEDLGFTEAQWKELSDDAKFDAAHNYVAEMGWIETWYEEDVD